MAIVLVNEPELPTPPPAAPAASPWLTRQRLQTLALAGATVLAFYLCYHIAEPFIPALTWALALAIIAQPVHRWIAAHVRNAAVAAALG